MASVHDVAAYIVSKTRPVSAMKLQKLVYYAQAWSLVWDERPLFGEPIEAWRAGPVVRELYDEHRGQFTVNAWTRGNTANLDATAKETIDLVLDAYGHRPAQWLSDLTHMEDPWRLARGGKSDGEHSTAVITHSAMAEYYGSLGPEAKAV